jgi:hypothetical protein
MTEDAGIDLSDAIDAVLSWNVRLKLLMTPHTRVTTREHHRVATFEMPIAGSIPPRVFRQVVALDA